MSKEHMWQSRVEIEHYSVAYFARIAAFKAFQRGTFVKGGAHMRYVNLPRLHSAYEPRP